MVILTDLEKISKPSKFFGKVEKIVTILGNHIIQRYLYEFLIANKLRILIPS